MPIDAMIAGLTQMAQDGIWIIDTEGKTVYVSDRMAEILGAARSELIGLSSFEFVFPEDLVGAHKLFESKKNGDSEPFHFKLRRFDATAVWVDVQGTPMHNAAGAFTGIVGTFTVSQK